MKLIEVHDLGYRVQANFWSKRRVILDGVDFAVERGEAFGFLGPNGAGKTTTIKALLGLLTPWRGSIQLFGKDARLPEVRRRLGFMPERAYFPEHLTARELLVMHGVLAGLKASEARGKATSLLERVGLGAAGDQRLRGYSKGMLQRAAFGQALMGSPELVIFDEPMSGLDPVGRRDFRELMVELRANGTTVFFSTHILPDVESICDRAAILIGGKVRRVAALPELLGGTDAGVEISVEQCTSQVLEQARALSRTQRQSSEGAAILDTANLETANRVIDVLRAGGARIVAIQTRRRSLEDVFMDLTRSST